MQLYISNKISKSLKKNLLKHLKKNDIITGMALLQLKKNELTEIVGLTTLIIIKFNKRIKNNKETRTK